MISRAPRLLFVFLTSFLAAGVLPAAAQSTLGRVVGIVRDASGAVMPGASVRLDVGLYSTDKLTPLTQGIALTVDRDSIAALTDSAVWSLLRQIWQRGQPPSPSLAAVTTRSLPALPGSDSAGEARA